MPKITISACDNELYLLAVPTTESPANSYQIAHIQSGNNMPVDVTIIIGAGTYSEQPMLYGVNTPLIQTTQDVKIPAGTYSVVAVGINWGVAQAYTFRVNSDPPHSFVNPTPGPLEVGWTKVVPSAFSVS